MLSTLRHGSFRWLFAGQVASAFGNFAFIVSVAALLVEAGEGAGTIGAVLALEALGVVVFVVPSGVIGDRFPRRRVMIVADFSRMLAVAAIALLGADASTVAIAALAFVVGGGQALFEPAYRGLLPRVLPDDQLQAGNALGSLSQQLSLFMGPAVSGVVIAIASPSAALGVSAAIFAGSWFCLLRVRESIPEGDEPDERQSMLQDVAEGIRAVRSRPWIAIVVGLAMIHLLVAIAPYDVLAPLIADDVYGSVAIYGWMLAAMGVGSVAGAVIGARMRPRLPGVVALLGLIPFCVALAALAVEPTLALVIFALVLTGVGEAIFDILWTTSLQRDVPDRLLSRVVSLDFLGSLALLPLGLAFTGPAVGAFGREAVLLFGAALAVVLLVPPLFSDQVRRFSSAPIGPSSDPAQSPAGPVSG